MEPKQIQFAGEGDDLCEISLLQMAEAVPHATLELANDMDNLKLPGIATEIKCKRFVRYANYNERGAASAG